MKHGTMSLKLYCVVSVDQWELVGLDMHLRWERLEMRTEIFNEIFYNIERKVEG